MFVLFVDVLVVVSDVLAVGDVLTLGCYAVFNEPVRQLLQGRDGTAHARRKASCSKKGIVLKIETAMPWVPHMWQLPH